MLRSPPSDCPGSCWAYPRRHQVAMSPTQGVPAMQWPALPPAGLGQQWSMTTICVAVSNLARGVTSTQPQSFVDGSEARSPVRRHKAKNLWSHRRAQDRTVTPWLGAPATSTVTLGNFV